MRRAKKINQDGVYKYYEVILVDPQHKAVRRDARINWICNPVHKRRESRGLTSAGKQNRGLNRGHAKGKNYAGWKKNNTLSLRRRDSVQIVRLLPVFHADFSHPTGTVKQLLGLLGSLLPALVVLGGSSSFLSASRGVRSNRCFPALAVSLSIRIAGSRSVLSAFGLSRVCFPAGLESLGFVCHCSVLGCQKSGPFFGLLTFLARDPANSRTTYPRNPPHFHILPNEVISSALVRLGVDLAWLRALVPDAKWVVSTARE